VSDRALDVLFIGDIVGSPGREACAAALAKMREDGFPDVVIANGENAAGGFGLTMKVYHELLDMGVSVVTLGNHTWDKQEILEFIGEADRLVRPLNYMDGTPGRGWTLLTSHGVQVAVINVMGRAFMPTVDCPFRAVEKALDEIDGEAPVIIVDVHAEATAEKMGLAWHFDGRVSAVLGTHTHVQTADEHILPNGTAYLTDAGMTGPRDSIIGMRRDLAVKKMITQLPCRLEVATGPTQFNAVRLRIDAASGKALTVQRLNYR
jgi:metallophosphoesterase (TIGR00282 family)